jgi:hypothetical protein
MTRTLAAPLGLGLTGAALLLLGLLAPPAGFFVIGLTVPPSPGMDGYVPAFLGGMAGCALSLVSIPLGVGSLIGAYRARRWAALAEA